MNKAEDQDEVVVAMDVSNTMRGGTDTHPKFDLALLLAAQVVVQAQKKGAAVGLMSFEEVLRGHIRPKAGGGHIQFLLQQLVAFQRLPDAALSELTSIQLEELVSRYLRLQYRVDLSAGERKVDPERWQRWRLSAQRRAAKDADSRDGLDGEWRRFLVQEGISIPYRVEARIGVKESGLVEVLRAVEVESR